MKIAGLVLGFLFLISSALQATSISISDIDFDRGISVSQTIEKIASQDEDVLPVPSEKKIKYGYDDSNEPDSIDDAAVMLDDAIHRLGISAKVIVHDSEPPFIKAIIGPLTGSQYSKMMKLFTREGKAFLYFGYEVSLKVSSIKSKYGYDDSNEPDSIDTAAIKLEIKIRTMGIPARVIVHESEPPFIKATIIGSVTDRQRKEIMKLFTVEDGNLLYSDYKVQLNVSISDISESDSIDAAAIKLEIKIRTMGIPARVIVHESEPPFIKATIIGSVTDRQRKEIMKLFTVEDGNLLYSDYKVQLNVFS